MNLLSLALALFVSPAAHAGQAYAYVCYPAKGLPLYDLEINPSRLSLRAAEGEEARLFLNQGERGGRGHYRSWLVYQYVLGEEGSDEPTRAREYFAETALLNGGRPMHNGSTGGFIAYLAADSKYHHLACELRGPL